MNTIAITKVHPNANRKLLYDNERVAVLPETVTINQWFIVLKICTARIEIHKRIVSFLSLSSFVKSEIEARSTPFESKYLICFVLKYFNPVTWNPRRSGQFVKLLR